MAILICKGLTRSPKNRKYPCLSLAQYLETGESYGYQIWRKCLTQIVSERCKMSFTVSELLKENQQITVTERFDEMKELTNY